MKKIFFLPVFLVFMLPAMAQEKSGTKTPDRREKRKIRIAAMVKQEEEGVISYRKHIVGGVKLTTDGYGGFIEIGRAQSIKKALLFQLDISERKHQKEQKQQLSGFSSTPITYGKINFLYPVKLGVQQQFLLGNKGNKNGVSVSANVGGGVSLGILRPYKIGVDSNGTIEYVGVKNDTALFLDRNRYVSGPNFGTGFNDIEVRPGAYAKAALRFDYGKFNETVNALEVGVTGEFYGKEINQMIFLKGKKYYFSAYIALMFGKRK